MKSYTLGPPAETFGPAIRIITVFGLFGVSVTRTGVNSERAPFSTDARNS